MKANFQPRVETFCGPRLPDVWVDDDGSNCPVELLSALSEAALPAIDKKGIRT